MSEIVCTMPGCNTAAGCLCHNRYGSAGWFKQIKRDAMIVNIANPAFAAGRLAGIREAAEVIVAQIQPPYTGTRSDDYMLGLAAGAVTTSEHNHAAILALAERGEG